MSRLHQVIVLGAVLIVALGAIYAERRAEHLVARAGFWFDGVTFDAPALTAALDSPLTLDEREQIERLAWTELRTAYAPFRIDLTDDQDARVTVRVVQESAHRTGIRRFAVAESLSLGALGGHGILSFEALASYALGELPDGADRPTIVSWIGRGLGRSAAHELAHCLLGTLNFHRGAARDSYEFGWVARRAQFDGPIRWDTAEDWLYDRLGASPATTS